MTGDAAKVLAAQFEADLGGLADVEVQFSMSALDAWFLLTQVQMAQGSRHNDSVSAGIAEEMGRELQDAMDLTPALEMVAEKGWEIGAQGYVAPRVAPHVALQLADIAVVARLCRVAGNMLVCLESLPDVVVGSEFREAIEAADRSVGRWAAEMEALEQ